MQQVDGEALPELGYRFAKTYWRMGYATEAARACLDHAFVTLELSTVYSYTALENEASQALMRRLAMEFWKEYADRDSGKRIVVYRIHRGG